MHEKKQCSLSCTKNSWSYTIWEYIRLLSKDDSMPFSILEWPSQNCCLYGLRASNSRLIPPSFNTKNDINAFLYKLYDYNTGKDSTRQRQIILQLWLILRALYKKLVLCWVEQYRATKLNRDDVPGKLLNLIIKMSFLVSTEYTIPKRTTLHKAE